MTNIKSGINFAAAAALLAMGAISTPSFAQSTKDVHCYGVNSCKGQSACKTAKNECKGMNSCKGQGFKEMSAQACTTAGGSLTEPK
jgi:hypothetical protein